MSQGRLQDAIAIYRQFRFSSKETIVTEGYSKDPLKEDSYYQPDSGLLHKYPGRIILLLTERCAVYCRYCTRSRLTRNNTIASELLQSHHSRLNHIIEYLNVNTQVNEVIFSGGDSLMLNNDILFYYAQQILRNTDIHRLRWHTRTVTALPGRYTNSFFKQLEYITQIKKNIALVFVTHINHAAEIDSSTSDIISKLKSHGVLVYNQAVLLKKVNDSSSKMIHLIEALMSAGIQPYYLHQLDRVAGSSHFYVPVKEGLALMHQIRKQLPGYMIPHYVIDSPEGKKTVCR